MSLLQMTCQILFTCIPSIADEALLGHELQDQWVGEQLIIMTSTDCLFKQAVEFKIAPCLITERLLGSVKCLDVLCKTVLRGESLVAKRAAQLWGVNNITAEICQLEMRHQHGHLSANDTSVVLCKCGGTKTTRVASFHMFAVVLKSWQVGSVDF